MRLWQVYSMKIELGQKIIDFFRGKYGKKLALAKVISKYKNHKKLSYNKTTKINILFVCHRPAIWNYLKSLFLACNNDKTFNVTIVAIPNKKQLPDLGLSHEIYESEG